MIAEVRIPGGGGGGGGYSVDNSHTCFFFLKTGGNTTYSPQVGPHTVYVFWTISVGPTLTPIYKVAM